MSQFGRPSSDITTGNWTTTPLYAKIDEVEPDDNDFVTSTSTDGTTDYFEVALSNLGRPAAGAGTLTVRMRKAQGEPTATFQLREGNTLIATQSVTATLTGSFANFDLTITQADLDSINNFNNLRLRVYMSNGTPAEQQQSRSA